MIIRLLTYFAGLILCFSQHAVISPKDSFTITIKHSQAYSQNHLLEINPQNFMTQWASIVAHYHSQMPQNILQASFKAVSREDSSQITAILGNCRFAGASAQWCKIGQASPPFNFQQSLLKVQLKCLTPCQAEILIRFTQTHWDGKSNPKFLGRPVPDRGPLITTKSEAFIKIIGWMVFTYLAVMGAIKLATNLADRLDRKPARAYYEAESKED